MDWKIFLLPGRIRKKDGYYHMIIDTKHPESNETIRHSASTKLKVEEQTKAKSKENFITANNMLTEFRKKWTNHYFSKEKKILLFTDYMRSWLDDVKPNLEYSTYSNYKLIIENKIIPYFEPKKIMLDELTAKEIQEFYSYSLNVCEVSPNTVLRYHANIRKALQTALKHGLVSNNQADLVERPKKKQYVASVVNKNEIFYLLEKIKDTYLEMPVYLAGFYGLRRSEVIGLLWSSIDFENNTFEINNTVTPIKENGVKSYVNRRRTKTKKSRRTLVLIPQLKEILLKKKLQIEYYREEFGNSYNKNYLDNVCVKEDGNIINPDYVTKKFTEITNELGFTDIHFHSLRHSFATFIYQEGVDMKTIQHWLGHSTISTTMDIYTHLPLQNMENTAKIIETLIKEKNGQ